MTADKNPSIFSRQMEAIVYIFSRQMEAQLLLIYFRIGIILCMLIVLVQNIKNINRGTEN